MAANVANAAAAANNAEEEGRAKLLEDGRAFFCSELVVKAWKICQIMIENNEACSNFLPADLAQGRERFELV